MTTRAAGGEAQDAEAVRTQVKRLPEKQVTDRRVFDEILAAGLMAHLAVVSAGQPYVLPVGYAPFRDGIMFHGSTASRLFKALAAGQPTCATVSLLDGLVLARSAFESSMEYRCAMLFGTCEVLTGDEKAAALQAFTDHALPGRWESIRHPSVQEDKATMALYLPATQWSVKIGEGFAEDADGDLEAMPDLWAGRVPFHTVVGPAVADEYSTALPVPGYVQAMTTSASVDSAGVADSRDGR